MGNGICAVRNQIVNQFHPTEIQDRPAILTTDSTVLSFVADGIPYVVKISWEFDDDYGDGANSTVDLGLLGQVLRQTHTHTVIIKNDGIHPVIS